ncbi:MAG: hypothetical protein ACRD12_09510 [Acidimicrobiales bacterium]
MAASLSTAERQVLGAFNAGPVTTDPVALTDVVRRRTLPQVTGPEFRRAVASLAERGLLRARVATKAGGEIGRVVIEDVTALGRAVVRSIDDGGR